MNNQRTILIVVCTVLVLALLSLARTFFGGKPSINLDPYEAVGIRAAEQTATLLGRKGRILVIAAELDSPVIGAEVKQFQKTLRKDSGLSVVAVETVMADPLRPAQFIELLNKYTGVDAVVSFYGFPEFSDAELARLPQPLPKIVAILTGTEGAKRLFAAGADGFILEGSPSKLQVIRAR